MISRRVTVPDKDHVVQTVVIEVSGGVVQEVYSDNKDLRVIKIDWDAGESPGDAFCGGPLFVQSVSAMPEETRKAVKVVSQLIAR